MNPSADDVTSQADESGHALGKSAAAVDAVPTPPAQMPASPPAGWYRNPQGAGQRYWDGSQWTGHYSGAPAPAMPTRPTYRPGSFWVAVAGLAAMAIGAFGPWATALGGAVTVNGTSGSRDGWLVLGAAVIAGACLATYASRGLTSRLAGATVFAILGGLVCVYDLVDISNSSASVFGTQVQIVHPGWGIYLALAGTAALAVGSLLARQHQRSA